MDDIENEFSLDACLTWLDNKWARHKELEDFYAAQHLRRLKQFVDNEANETGDLSTRVNMNAAAAGDFLYQEMPGWDYRRPLEEPKSSESEGAE